MCMCWFYKLTHCLHYNCQLVRAVYGGGGGSDCLFGENHEKRKCSLWVKGRIVNVELGTMYSMVLRTGF
jgi:hypothetical protein